MRGVMPVQRGEGEEEGQGEGGKESAPAATSRDTASSQPFWAADMRGVMPVQEEELRVEGVG